MQKYVMLILSMSLIAFASIASADTVALKPDAPYRYVVQKGDTLNTVAKIFLQDPSQISAIWSTDPNTHKLESIYPGDTLILIKQNGVAKLELEKGAPIKLSPKTRSKSYQDVRDTIPLDKIKPFLTNTRVMTKEELNSAPYVIGATDEHLAAASQEDVYVRGLNDKETKQYSLYRLGETYKDPETQQILGYEAEHVGDAQLAVPGSPATLLITRALQPIVEGDRVFPYSEVSETMHFIPSTPKNNINGQIISVVNGVDEIGQYNVVVINRGENEGLIVGNKLGIYNFGEQMRDPISTEEKKKAMVRLPERRMGTLMIFRTFPEVSYALVTKASGRIHVKDRVEGGPQNSA